MPGPEDRAFFVSGITECPEKTQGNASSEIL